MGIKKALSADQPVFFFCLVLNMGNFTPPPVNGGLFNEICVNQGGICESALLNVFDMSNKLATGMTLMQVSINTLR